MIKFSLILPFVILNFTCLIGQDCLKAHYTFNGDVNDLSGNFYHAEVMDGHFTKDMTGFPGHAFHFDGINDYISLNNYNHLVSSSEFTICVWAKMDGPGGGLNQQNILFGQRDDFPAAMGQSCILLMAEDENSNTRFLLRGSEYEGSSWEMIASPSPAYHEWHHYAAVLDSDDTMRLFIDGMQVEAGFFPQAGNFCASIDHTYIGANMHSGGSVRGLFQGDMDEFRVYHLALTNEEIHQIYSTEVESITVSLPDKPVTPEIDPVKVSPNPFSTSTYIILDETVERPVSIALFDMKGVEVLTISNVLLSITEIERDSLPEGEYILRIGNDKQIFTRKLIVQ